MDLAVPNPPVSLSSSEVIMEPSAFLREGPVHSTTNMNVWVLTGFWPKAHYRHILCVAKSLSEIERAANHYRRNHDRLEIEELPVWE